MEHVLVIGGSGILRSVCCHFAEQGKVVSVVARNKEKIVEMVAETQKSPGLINAIAADYTDIPAFQPKLVEAVAHLGQPVLTITRINPEAFLARQSVAGFLNDHATGSRMFDLCCGKKDASGCAGLVSANSFKIQYRRIILGSMVDGEKSRQLTADEIRKGVLDAISEDKIDYTIGAL